MTYRPQIRVGIDWDDDGYIHLSGKSDSIFATNTPLTLNGSTFFAPDNNFVPQATFSPAVGEDYGILKGEASLTGVYSGVGAYIPTITQNDEYPLNYIPAVGDTYTALAQPFLTPERQPIISVSLYMRQVGTPTGNVTLRMETNNSGEPSGELVSPDATASVDVSTLDTSLANVVFTFDEQVELAGVTQYWLVLTSDITISSSDYIIWGVFYNTDTDYFVLNYNVLNNTSVTLQ